MQVDASGAPKKPNFSVVMKVATWARDSHGLFDYEDLHVERKTLTTRLCRFLVRKGTGEVQLMNEKEVATQVGPADALLLKVYPSKTNSETFVVENCSKTGIYEEAIDKLWLITKSLKKNSVREEYKLKRGEILKLGRIRLKVKDYRIEDGASEEDKTANQIEEGPIDIKHCEDRPKDENDVCRICFSNTMTPDNPLFAPCKCTGTMKFIHFTCLKSWLNLKLVQQQTKQLRSYYWKSFECEICKTTYPFCIDNVGTKHYLADVQKPEKGSFILLESLIHEKNTSRIVNVIMPSEEKSSFKLGRGHESDVRITDISVSRFHAWLRCTKDGYYIEDNNSKFGTLALVPSVELNPTLARAVQVGRTAISFAVKPTELDSNMAKALLAVDPATMQNLIQDSLLNAAEMDVDSENGKKANEPPKAEEKHEEPMDIPPDEHNNDSPPPSGNNNQ